MILEYWREKGSSVARVIYIERTKAKVIGWNFLIPMTLMRKKDNIDAKLLSYLNSKQKDFVRSAAQKS